MKSSPDRTKNWEFLNRFLATLIQLQFREITLSENASSTKCKSLMILIKWNSFFFSCRQEKSLWFFKISLSLHGQQQASRLWHWLLHRNPMQHKSTTAYQCFPPAGTNCEGGKNVRRSNSSFLTCWSFNDGWIFISCFVIVWNTGHEERPFKTDVYVS